MPVSLRAPDDFHVHFRQPPLLGTIVSDTARWFGRALVMPNTVPPITTADRLAAYRRDIEAAVGEGCPFEPLLTFKVVQGLADEQVRALAAAGAIGGKLYPQGVTTHSEDGVFDVASLAAVFEAMEELDLVLEIHAEAPGAFSLDREIAYLPTVEWIVRRFSHLRIVIEHVSSRDMLAALADLPPRVAATVTVHHLLLTLDDVIGGDLRPHHFCKPIAKRSADRDALCAAVLSGDPRVFFGSDSAPHPRSAKESDCGCAGIYTAPVAVPLLAEFFERAGLPLTESALPPQSACLESFVSRWGAEFYRLPLNERTITLSESQWVVPDDYDGVVPFRSGAKLRYDIATGGEA